MWPFKRRKSYREIDLDELAETTPAKIYANLLLLEMARGDVGERLLRRSQPLPWPAHYAEEELPPFAVVVNCLKVMSTLDPIAYHAPKEGRIELGVGLDGRMQEVIIHTRFDDFAEDPAVHLRMEFIDQ